MSVQSNPIEPPPSNPSRAEPSGAETRQAPAFRTSEPICVGYRLKENLYDNRGTLLVRAGTVITERMMDLLTQWQRRAGKTRMVPAGHSGGEHARMSVAFSSRLSDALDQAAERGTSLIVTPGGSRLPYRAVHSLGGSLENAMAKQQERQLKASGELQQLAHAVQAGATADTDAPLAMVNELVDRVWTDPDLLLALAPFREAHNEYVFLHAINVCTLSILLAQHMGYGGEDLRTLGLAALLHDIGMLRVPAEIRKAARVLGPDEMYEVMKHPFYTVEMLERLPRLPHHVPLIAYQVHERADAEGYPRKRHPNMVHAFAKIIAVADVYNAMIAQRPWREPVQTYTTMIDLLNQTSQGRFDRDTVRALIERVGLFPVGSVVILNTGMQCLVRRANPGCHVRPIVEVIGPPDSPKIGQLVDLAEWAHLEVTHCMTIEAFAAEQAAASPLR